MDKIQKFKKFNQMIKKSDSIFIMGHKDLDLDAIGSAIGIYELAVHLKKKAYIILNDKKHEAGVKRVLELVKGDISFISSEEVSDYIQAKSLLVIVDVNKPLIMQDGQLVSLFSDTVILDHHDKNETSLVPTLEIIDSMTSSTSEIVTEYFYYYDYSFSSLCATFLLAGITIDTNEFLVKTSAKTHYAAYCLLEYGASLKDVNALLKQDLEEYILRQKVITDLEVLNKNIAFAKGSSRIFYKREELAKIADTILEFNHIETSYVIGKLSDDEIGISARSIGSVNVGEVLSLLGGGGDRHDAACRISGKTLKEVEEELKQVLGVL